MARPRDFRRLSRRARHLIRRLRSTKHASVQAVTVHELENEIHRRRFGRAASTGRTAAPDGARTGHWRPLTHRAKKLLTQLRRTKVWAVQRRLVKELVTEMSTGRRRMAALAARAKPAVKRAARPFARGKRALARVRRSRSTWASAGRSWQSARAPQARAARAQGPRVRTPAPSARTTPSPRGRLAPGGRPGPARTRS